MILTPELEKVTKVYQVVSRVSSGKLRVKDAFNRGSIVETDKPFKKGDHIVVVSGVPIRKIPTPSTIVVQV